MRSNTLPARRMTAGLALCLALLCQSLFIFAAPVSAQVRKTKKARAKKAKPTRVLPARPVVALPPAAAPQIVAPRLVAPRVEESRPAAADAQVAVPPARSPADAIRQQTPSPQPQAEPAAEGALTSVRVTSVETFKVNFGQFSKQAQKSIKRAASISLQEIPAPMTITEVGAAGPVSESLPRAVAEPADAGGTRVPSPAPAQNFLGLEDGAKTGTGTFTIPPDTMGAVGFDKVFVTLNNNYRVQDKATGAPLSTVSIDTFWSATGATGVFDPRIQFDPYQQRWLLTAVAGAQTANSSVLVGVSDTADPQGSYTLFRIIVGCAAGSMGCNAQGEWADFPMLGFNQNWLAIGWNQFTINTSAFVGGKMLVLDYPTLRTGTATGTLFTNASAATGFCMHPVTTFSAAEETLYVPTHQQSAGALYRLHKITGTPAAPVFTLDATARTRPGGGWTQPGGDNLPQQCVLGIGAPTQTCPATPRGLEASDSFIRSNAVFRNGRIFYPQAIALPAGGLTAASRFAAQWTALNPDGTFFDGGRVEDATAQVFNGGKHYSYPSLAVNKHGDILFGFSEFESDDYVDAGYTFRLASDPAGTMRDPVIYKEGEDYYQKTFSGTRNRWGDYSHTVVDPVNDRDMWTIQEYAGLRVGTTGQGANDSRWSTWWAKVSVPAGAGDLLISEFRLRGPAGANDEFIEIYNNSGADHTVQTADGSAGYAIAAEDNVVRCTIPNGTVIPNRGHYLCVNSVGYSLASYPAGNGTTATGDATYTTDIPDNSGLAIFRTATVADFTEGNRIDAAGFATTPAGPYVEGAGIPSINPTFDIDHAFYRDNCGKGGSITTLGPCPTAGLHKDTDNNASDFVFVDTNGTSAGAGQRLGAPGPENLSSPIISAPGQFGFVLVDATTGAAGPPNRVRDLTSDPANNSTFGTLSIRRRVVNNTGSPVTRLRFRIADLTTFPAPSGFADMRLRTSGPVVVSGVNDPATCSPMPTPCAVTVAATTLEEPPAQPNGGGFNSTLSAGAITLATPLAPGASVNVQFLLGLQQTGNFKFIINIEVLP